MPPAADGAEVDHLRHGRTGAHVLGQSSRQRIRGVHLANTGIQHRDVGPLEHALALQRQRHHQQRIRKVLVVY